MPVHLVAHSMGGLMVRAALMDLGRELWPKLGRVVFLGTPHYGSPAIAGYLKNHLWGFELIALLGLYLSRQTLRSLWGVLGMLPAPRGIYPGTRPGDPAAWRPDDSRDAYVHPCANFDIYRAEDWKLDLTPTQFAQLQKVLDGAAEFHRRMYESHQALDQTLREPHDGDRRGWLQNPVPAGLRADLLRGLGAHGQGDRADRGGPAP